MFIPTVDYLCVIDDEHDVAKRSENYYYESLKKQLVSLQIQKGQFSDRK